MKKLYFILSIMFIAGCKLADFSGQKNYGGNISGEYSVSFSGMQFQGDPVTDNMQKISCSSTSLGRCRAAYPANSTIEFTSSTEAVTGYGKMVYAGKIRCNNSVISKAPEANDPSKIKFLISNINQSYTCSFLFKPAGTQIGHPDLRERFQILCLT